MSACAPRAPARSATKRPRSRSEPPNDDGTYPPDGAAFKRSTTTRPWLGTRHGPRRRVALRDSAPGDGEDLLARAETRAPVGHALLPRPVAFHIEAGADAGVTTVIKTDFGVDGSLVPRVSCLLGSLPGAIARPASACRRHPGWRAPGLLVHLASTRSCGRSCFCSAFCRLRVLRRRESRHRPRNVDAASGIQTSWRAARRNNVGAAGPLIRSCSPSGSHHVAHLLRWVSELEI